MSSMPRRLFLASASAGLAASFFTDAMAESLPAIDVENAKRLRDLIATTDDQLTIFYKACRGLTKDQFVEMASQDHEKPGVKPLIGDYYNLLKYFGDRVYSYLEKGTSSYGSSELDALDGTAGDINNVIEAIAVAADSQKLNITSTTPVTKTDSFVALVIELAGDNFFDKSADTIKDKLITELEGAMSVPVSEKAAVSKIIDADIKICVDSVLSLDNNVVTTLVKGLNNVPDFSSSFNTLNSTLQEHMNYAVKKVQASIGQKHGSLDEFLERRGLRKELRIEPV